MVLDGKWQQISGRQLSEKTYGIIGCGHVGKALVKLSSCAEPIVVKTYSSINSDANTNACRAGKYTVPRSCKSIRRTK